jgi:membrane fusion protein, multidrug efflux system
MKKRTRSSLSRKRFRVQPVSEGSADGAKISLLGGADISTSRLFAALVKRLGRTRLASRASALASISRRKPLLTLPVALAMLAGCSSQPSTTGEEAHPAKTMIVGAGDRPNVRSFPGRVEASRMVDLAFQVPGVLARIPVKEGEKVAKGAIIAQLRQDEFQARLKTVQGQLDQARSQLRAAESRLANAKSESESYSRLVESSAVSRSDYDLAETTSRVAQENQSAQEAAVRALEGRLVEANLQLGDSAVRAPYDGVVAQRLVDEGQNITPNSPVVRFQNVDEINIVVDVPESFMAADSRAAAIQQSVAEFSTSPGRQFPVRLREVTQVADPRTQIFQVRFTTKAPPGVTVLPGMTATVTITSRGDRGSSNRIFVPISAVAKLDAGEQVVWILGSDQTVHRRPVKMGGPTGDRIEVVEGLHPGDRIVVAGAAFLREGMKVRDLGDSLGSGQQ